MTENDLLATDRFYCETCGRLPTKPCVSVDKTRKGEPIVGAHTARRRLFWRAFYDRTL